MANLVVSFKVCAVLIAASLIFCALINKGDSRWLMKKPLAIMVLAFPIASFVPSVWALTVVLIVLLPAISRTKGEAAALYITAILSLPIINKTISVASSTVMTFDSYMALSVGLLLCSWILPGKEAARTTGMHLPVLALLLIETVGGARGLNVTSVGRTTLEQVFAIALPYYAMMKCMNSERDVRRVMIAFCFAITTQSLLAVYEARMSWPIYEGLQRSFGEHLNISQATKMRAGFMRANGTLPESTSFAWVLALALGASVCIRSHYRSIGHFCFAIIIIMLGLLACQARAGWLAAALIIIMPDIYQFRLSSAAFKVVACSAVYFVVSAMQKSSAVLSSFAASGAETYDYRVRLFRRGMEEISKNPFFGTDLATVMWNLRDLKQGEGIIDFVNAYIYITLVTGAVGLAIFVGQFLYVQARVIKAKRYLLRPRGLYVGAWVFSVSATTMITAYTSGFGGSVLIFYLLVLAIGSRLAVYYDEPRQTKARLAAPF